MPPALRTAFLILFLIAPLHGDDLKKELRAYRKSVGRPALWIRTLAIEKLAATRDVAALKLLARRYKRAEEPSDHVAYLVAGISAEKFTDQEEHGAIWAKWLKSSKKPQDAWLWYLGQRLKVKWGQVEEVSASLGEKRRSHFQKAATVLALANAAPGAQSLAVVPGVLDPKALKRTKSHERAALQAACAVALVKGRSELGKESFTLAALAVIDQIDDEATLKHNRWVIARHLARALGISKLYLSGESWRTALAGASAKAQRGEEPRPGGTRLRPVGLKPGATIPRFLGIEGTGTRIAFLIDCSDSMLIPISEAEKEEIKRGPRREVTGSDPNKGKPGGLDPTPPAGKDDPLAKLPWDRIKTRFDAAREALILSLESLGSEMQYAVITFGTDAEVLGGQGLIRANDKNRRLTINALRRMRVAPPDEKRPHGRLKGYTNLHGALLDAYRITDGRPIELYEHTDPRGFSQGVDTIFVLSDGAPSWDDFNAVDVNDLGLTSGDPESGHKGAKSPTLNFYGPYILPNHLMRDLVRLNLFRRVEVHCIGIGEANAALLKGMAAIGGGQFRSVSAR
ncbi:MAG: hypothetical protein JKY65_25610 [Planctomycetes bacterium]|nr:hypothetical protein [Planctomycetota bacterium]